MTIRFITAWERYPKDAIVTLEAPEESRLIALGFATADLDLEQEYVQTIYAVTDKDGSVISVKTKDGKDVSLGGGGATSQTLTYGATITSNASLGQIMSLTLTGDCEITSISNMSITKPVTLLVTQDATGGRNLIVENTDFGAGLSGQKLTIALQYDGTENRLVNSPVWS